MVNYSLLGMGLKKVADWYLATAAQRPTLEAAISHWLIAICYVRGIVWSTVEVAGD